MKFKIFVSGVQKELKSELSAVREFVAENVLLREYFSVFLFEESPASGKSSKTIYLQQENRGKSEQPISSKT